MTQEDKNLLLKDLCARLPYGVKVTNGIHTITLTPCSDTSIIIKNEHILPYLRPMSSMTEEEKKEYGKVCELDTEILANHPMNGEPFPALYNSQDWLNAHHFDFRCLIQKGLALEAKGGIYDN